MRTLQHSTGIFTGVSGRVAFPLALRLGALGVPLTELADNGAALVVTGNDFFCCRSRWNCGTLPLVRR